MSIQGVTYERDFIVLETVNLQIILLTTRSQAKSNTHTRYPRMHMDKAQNFVEEKQSK